MTSREHVQREIASVRTQLHRTRLAQAILASLAAGLVCVGLIRLSGVALARAGVSNGAWLNLLGGWLPWLIGATAAIALFARYSLSWQPITLVRAALWYEERYPSQHAVVTLLDTAPDSLAPSTERVLVTQAERAAHNRPAPSQLIRASLWRSTRTALSGALLAVITLALLARFPASALAGRTEAPTGRTASGVPGADDSNTNRLRNWRIEVTAPAYAGGESFTLDDSTSATGLVGSAVRIIGPGTGDGLAAEWTERGGEPRTLPIEGSRAWTITMRMPARPAVVRVAEGEASRVLTLVPRADSLPVVQLRTPVRDSVYRETDGTLPLSATATDDLGLASLVFEVIVTSGSGEQYSARTLTVGQRALQGARTGSTSHTLSFRELQIAPGDVMHVRAVARDRHPAASREAGVSETRSVRFARPGEYDSVAVEAAPPPVVDSSLLSQRMLLDLTEKLEARRPRITRELLVSESRQLATEQARIRRAVSALVFQRLTGEGESEHVHYEGDGHDHGLTSLAGKLVPSFGGGTPTAMPGATPPPGASGQPNNNATDESPIIALNRPLLEAYNAMWDAGRALELADPREAIPPMRRALEAIQRARAAERVYLRGRVRPIVVDLARVRLAGRDTGQSSRRVAGETRLRAADAFEERLLRAAELLPVNGVAARDSLVTLRLDALADAPSLAQALERVLSAITTGDDATPALVRARRSLSPPVRAPGISPWSVP